MAQSIDRASPLIVAEKDNVPPLFYWTIWAFTKLVGSELAVRLPSAISSLLTLPLIYLLGVRMFSSRVIGLAAAAIAAASPFAVWHAQDGRMYSLLVLLACVELLFFWEIVAHELKWWHLVGLTLATSLAVHTHQYGGLVNIACGVFLLVWVGLSDRRFWAWLLCQLIAALSFVPWLLLSAEQVGSLKTGGVAKSHMLFWVPYTFYTYLFGYSLGPSVRELHGHVSLSSIKSDLWCLGPTSLAALWIGAVILKRGLKPDVRRAAVFCLTLLAISISLPLLMTTVTKIAYNVRYTSVSFPAFLLLLGLAVKAGRSIATRFALCTILLYVLMSLYNYYYDHRYFKEEVRPAIALLTERLDPSDSLVVSSDTTVMALVYYGFDLPRDALVVRHTESGSNLTLDQALHSLERLKLDRGRRIWFIECRAWETDPLGKLQQWLDTNGVRFFAQDWPGVKLSGYTILQPAGPASFDL